MPVSQTIDNLLNGVSQQPTALRLPSQAEEQVNGLSRFSDGGPSKRPGTTHLFKLSSDTTGADSAFVHPLNMGANDRYYVVIADGVLRVYDKLTGLPVSVLTPNGTGYLTPEDSLPRFVLADTFTGTNGTDLAAHTSDIVVGWLEIFKSGTGAGAQIQNNKMEQTRLNVLAITYALDFEIPSNDYTVSAKIKNKGSTLDSSQRVLLRSRMNGSTRTGYALSLVLNSSGSGGVVVSIRKVDAAGSQTSLTSVAVAGTSGDEDHVYALRHTGNFIEALMDGVVVTSVTDSTYPTGGYVGVYLADPQTLDRVILVDDFTLTYPIAIDSGRESYRAVTVGDRTYITNTTVQVQQDTTRKAPALTPQAVIYLEQADFSTTFAVTIDGVTVAYETPAGAEASARRSIGTDAITSELMALLTDAFADFTFNQFGSMIRVQRTDGADFTISAADGLADNGILIVKNTVQRTTDLPLRCVDGYVVEVVGGPEEAKDTYWVKFDSQGSDDFRGVWKECVRPGEGIAFDPTTMPHELVYSAEIVEQTEARGFPAQPVVKPALPVKDFESWEGSLNGGDAADNHFFFLRDHQDDIFVNLEDTNGGPIKVGVKYTVSTTKMETGETAILTIAHNDGASSTDWTTVFTRSFQSGVYLSNEVTEVEISTPIGANWDLRVMLEYASGSTPSDSDKRAVVGLAPNQQGIWYYNFSAIDVTWPTDTVYPKGTEWTVTVEGDDATYTQTTDMTGSAIATALETLVEALTGVTSSVVTNDKGTAIRITLDAGGLPEVTASGSFDDETLFWNPDIDLGFDGADLDGKILKNLSDGSEGIITDCYATGITVSELTGGVENKIRNGDLIVVVDVAPRFTFRQIRWADRAAGDSITNPWPSIRDGFVRDVFYTRGRLGMLSGGNIVLSEAGRAGNLFRTATTDLLDADPIDTKPATGGTVTFHSAVDWDGRCLLWTDTAQFELQGEPLLTPATVALVQLTKFDSSPVRPLVVGSRIYFARGMTTSTRMFEYRVRQNNDRPDAVDITRDLPSYLTGYPVSIVGDTSLGFVAVLTDSDLTNLYTYSAHYEDNEQYQSAWSRWEFAADSQIVGMDFVDGTLGIIFVRSDGLFLETLDLDADASGLLLDRRLDEQSGTYSASKTTWTLPYSIPTDGSEGTVVVVVNGAVVATSRPTATTVATTADVNLSASDATIGVRYDFRYTLSTLFPRSREGKADTMGRLQLSRAKLHYKGSREFDVEVTPTGRAKRTYSFSETSAEDGEFPFQIATRNTTALIEIVNDSPFPSCITGLDWEGTLVNRSRRI